jgi:hypothetical protein
MRMTEIGLVVGALLALSGGVWAWGAVAPDVLLVAGLWLLAAGLGFGLPTGLLYHVALQRSLAKLGRLPPRWWLRPISLHPLVPPEDALAVFGWCRLGALGCAVAFLGCGVFALGALRTAFAG